MPCFGTQARQSPFLGLHCEIASVVPLPRNDSYDTVSEGRALFEGKFRTFCIRLKFRIPHSEIRNSVTWKERVSKRFLYAFHFESDSMEFSLAFHELPGIDTEGLSDSVKVGA